MINKNKKFKLHKAFFLYITIMLRFLYIIFIFSYTFGVRLFSSSLKNKINLEFFHGSNIDSSFYLPFLNKLLNDLK